MNAFSYAEELQVARRSGVGQAGRPCLTASCGATAAQKPDGRRRCSPPTVASEAADDNERVRALLGGVAKLVVQRVNGGGDARACECGCASRTALSRSRLADKGVAAGPENEGDTVERGGSVPPLQRRDQLPVAKRKGGRRVPPPAGEAYKGSSSFDRQKPGGTGRGQGCVLCLTSRRQALVGEHVGWQRWQTPLRSGPQ